MTTATVPPSGYADPAVRAATADVVRPGGLELTDHAIAACGLRPGARVLDVGCGAGVTVEHLTDRQGLRAVGVDVCAELLAAGRARRPGLTLLEARAERLPLADRSVDAALAECVLSAVADPDAALAELARVLRPGAPLVVTDLYARDAAGSGALRHLPPGSCLHGLLTAPEQRDRLRAAGFRLRRREDHSGALAALAVRLLWQDGSTARLWCPGGTAADADRVRAAVRRARPGYVLLIAENGRG